jgi:hypothetical protein
VQLGGTALGTTQAVAAAATLTPYPTDIYKTKDHLNELIEPYGKVASSVRQAIDETAAPRRRYQRSADCIFHARSTSSCACLGQDVAAKLAAGGRQALRE